MSYRLPPLSALKAFEAAGRLCSFKEAALELNVTPAAISQQIKTLEDRLGFLLFERKTREITLTDKALLMLPKVIEGFECFSEALNKVTQEPDHALTVLAPPSFTSRWLIPRLSKFWAEHPDVALRIASTPDNIDQKTRSAFVKTHHMIKLEPESDISIRYGAGDYPGLEAIKIFSPEYIPVCNPNILRDDKPLKNIGDLLNYTLIHDETTHGAEQPLDWQEWFSINKIKTTSIPDGPRFSNSLLAIDAAISGQGIALAPKLLVASELASNLLVAPFALETPSPYAYYLVIAKESKLKFGVQSFCQWIKQA